MLYLGIANAKCVREEFLDLLSPKEKEKLCSIKDRERKREYLCSHCLLRIMRKEIFGFCDGELLYNENGKPYFEGKEDFSIAHADGLCAVILTDEKNVKVGLDIQKRGICDSRKTRIGERFFKYLPLSNAQNFPEEIKMCFYVLDSYPEIKRPAELKFLSEESFEYAWTRLEAFLKMKGTGFSSLKENDVTECKISSYEYSDCKVSVCKSKK